MDKRTIVWTTRASNEIRSILEFYAERNQSTAYSRWLLNEVNYRIKLIKLFPRIGRQTEQSGVFLFPFHHYGIIYRFTRKQLFILSIWDFRQNPNDRVDA